MLMIMFSLLTQCVIYFYRYKPYGQTVGKLAEKPLVSIRTGQRHHNQQRLVGKTCLLYFLLLLFISFPVEGRIQIRQTGSSTVYPFAMKVAQEFSKKPSRICPLVVSTNTGTGFFDLTQSGFRHDIIGASRVINPQELNSFKKLSVQSLLEICIGIDGIALAVKKNLKGFNLKLVDIFQAIAHKVSNQKGEMVENPYKKWSDINPSYPDIPIRILIPSKSHGTRATFEVMVMQGHDIRNGPEVREISDYEAADSHDLLFDYLKNNDKTMAFVAASLLTSHHDYFKPLAIDLIEPTILNIQRGRYPITRKLFIYVNEDNYETTERLREYIDEWLSPEAIGKDGYLTKMGLIPLLENQKKQRKL